MSTCFQTKIIEAKLSMFDFCKV